MTTRKIAISAVIGIALCSFIFSGSRLQMRQNIRFAEQKIGEAAVFSLANDLVRCSARVESGKLVGDSLEALPKFLAGQAGTRLLLETDADFGLDIMWTDWQAPGRVNNAENPVLFSKKDFRFAGHKVQEFSDGAKELELTLAGENTPFEIRLTYRLEPDAFYARRKLGVRLGSGPPPKSAFSQGPHFLRWIWPRRGAIHQPARFSLLKPGGFGQPVAVLMNSGGAFCGLEYPAAENSLRLEPGRAPDLRCGQEIGERIGDSWIESEWTVEALTPDPFVKLWFWKYLNRIRAAPIRPYVLHNSWYDLRSPDYKKGPERTLDEGTLLNAAGIIGEKLVRRHGVGLDAFVLDDGWDVFAGDWVLSPAQFPRGLGPISEALRPIGARLGIWIGPVGGYFQRDVRVNWMKERGYETVGGQMCIAGERYKALLKKRIMDFIRNDQVGYFKWDGIQFSCSEPDHGHPPDIYSRRAAMEAVAELSRAARSEGKDMFLNITSGTWLSPWWVKYADTIWMQGQDYGFADVPSISRRDQSTTYRDSVLFDDLRSHDFWFPVSSLMTHGVIKAHISPFADPKESLDKFVDEVVLYAARGIAMWELYVSPDLLSDAEWEVEAASIRWLKANFAVLKNGEMIGGDPRRHEPYGYVHFLGRRGIIAVRNPVIDPQTQRVEFSPAFGLDDAAADLVLERVYPSRWISPKLFRAGDSVDLPLQGFETAVYELYPLSESKEPLLAGAVFDSILYADGEYVTDIYEATEEARLLNPGKVKEVTIDGASQAAEKWTLPESTILTAVRDISFRRAPGVPGKLEAKFWLQEPAINATLAFLVTPAEESQGKTLPVLEASDNGRKVDLALEQEKGSWSWHKFEISPGDHAVELRFSLGPLEASWTGRVSCWLITREKFASQRVVFRMNEPAPLRRAFLPRPFPAGVLAKTLKIGETGVALKH